MRKNSFGGVGVGGGGMGWGMDCIPTQRGNNGEVDWMECPA